MTQCIIDNRASTEAWRGKRLVEYLYIDDFGAHAFEHEPASGWLKCVRPFGAVGSRPREFAALSMDEFLIQGTRRQYLFSSMQLSV